MAAGIGFWAITRQLRHNKVVERDATWWKSFEWVSSRALPTDGTSGLPYLISVDMLAPLAASARDAVQERACGAFIDHLDALNSETSPETQSGPAEQASREAADDPSESETDEVLAVGVPSDVRTTRWSVAESDRERSTLENYAKQTANSSARSFSVEERLYRLLVRDAVRRVAAAQFKVLPGSKDTSSMWVVNGQGDRVFVVPAGSMRPSNIKTLAGMLSVKSMHATLLVTKNEVPDSNPTPADHVIAVQWSDEGDDAQLRLGLLRAFEG